MYQINDTKTNGKIMYNDEWILIEFNNVRQHICCLHEFSNDDGMVPFDDFEKFANKFVNPNQPYFLFWHLECLYISDKLITNELMERYDDSWWGKNLHEYTDYNIWRYGELNPHTTKPPQNK